MTTDLTVANEIKRQLGGRRFEVMTGARDFLGDKYTVTAWRVERPTARNGYQYKAHEKAQVSDVYCDSLRDVFTSITGLAVSL